MCIAFAGAQGARRQRRQRRVVCVLARGDTGGRKAKSDTNDLADDNNHASPVVVHFNGPAIQAAQAGQDDNNHDGARDDNNGAVDEPSRHHRDCDGSLLLPPA
jgi:hypothetical protein